VKPWLEHLLLGTLFAFTLGVADGRAQGGTSAIAALQLGQGLRAASLGGAYVGEADDPAALYYNPAGLGRVDFSRVEAAHELWYGEVQREQLQLAWPMRVGSMGVSLTYLHVPAFVAYDASDNVIGEVSAATIVGSVGYGMIVGRNVSLGATAIIYSQRLDNVTATGPAFTLGAQWQLERITLGAAARNIGPAVDMQTQGEALPTEFAAGLSWRAPVVGLTMGLEADFPQNGNTRLKAGAEYVSAVGLSLRTGYTRVSGAIGDGGDDLVFGAGFAVGSGALHYSYTVGNDFGTLHRLGLSWWLGGGGF
jgi:hypothetical protein